jgi:hypothetical protein
MLHAGLDLSRRRLDVCLVDDAGELVAQLAAAPDTDGLRHLARRVVATRVRAVIESMTVARFVHDTRSRRGSSAVRFSARARITRVALTSACIDRYHMSCSCDSALSSCGGRIATRLDRCHREAASFESRHLL